MLWFDIEKFELEEMRATYVSGFSEEPPEAAQKSWWQHHLAYLLDNFANHDFLFGAEADRKSTSCNGAQQDSNVTCWSGD